MMKKLYVGNLSYRTTESELRQVFGKFGVVNQVSIITDRETGRSKGFAFVEMQNDQEANDAIQGMNGVELGERALAVNEARPQEPRKSGGGGKYGGGGGGNRRY
jgi:RNA recognition motif-containing protein